MNLRFRDSKIVATVRYRSDGREVAVSRLFGVGVPLSTLLSFIEIQVGSYAATSSLQLSEYTGSSDTVGTSGET